MSYFSEQGRLVFIKLQPEKYPRANQIGILDSGDFEVTCFSTYSDLTIIRKQIRSIIEKQMLEKKMQ